MYLPTTYTGYVLQYRWSDDQPWRDWSGLCATYDQAYGQITAVGECLTQVVRREITDVVVSPEDVA